MRLIDADRLKKKVLKWLPSDPCGIEEKEHPIETDIVVSLMMEIEEAPTVNEWIPCSERLPEHSYTKRFWLTVKLDDDKGTVDTLIGTWGAWGGDKGNKLYDAFDCWKDVMINGGIYRMSQPIPKEQVLAWMPLPEPYRRDSEA